MRKLRIAAMVLLALMVSVFKVSTVAQSAADYKAKCQMCYGATGIGDTPMGKKLNTKDSLIRGAEEDRRRAREIHQRWSQ